MNLSLILLDFLDDLSFSKEIQTKQEKNVVFSINKKLFGKLHTKISESSVI